MTPERFDAWLLAPEEPIVLRRLRALVGGFAVAYLLIRAPAILRLLDRPASEFQGVGPLWWLDEPVADDAASAWLVATVVAGIAFTCGLWFRVSGPAFVLGLVAITTYRSSWGQLLHFDNLLALHTFVIGFSPAADPDGPATTRHGWPIRLTAIVTVTTYVLAGIAKLRIGGWAWLDGETLRNHVAFSATRLELLGERSSPLAAPFVRAGWLTSPLAAATVLIELSAPVALSTRWRTPWIVAAWSMHLAIAATMFVVFAYPLFLVAFAPLLLERGKPKRADLRCKPARSSG